MKKNLIVTPHLLSWKVGKFWTVLSLLAVCSITSFRHYYNGALIDDAYITFRYARNIATGYGYVYNPEEYIQGTSTPLFTLLLAFVAWLGADIPTASTIIGAISVTLTVVMVFFALRSLQSSVAGIVGVAFMLTSSAYMSIATDGMETATYIFFIALSFYLFITGYENLSFLVASFCLLIRLDGAAVLLSLTIISWWRQKAFPYTNLLIPVLLIGLWFGFSYTYFGSVFPNSLLAKQYHTNHDLISSWMLSETMRVSPLYWFLALSGVYLALRKVESKLLPIAIWAGVYLFAYSVAEIEGYPWYFTPILLCIMFAAAYGLGGIVLAISSDKPYHNTQLIMGCVLLVIGILPVLRTASREPFGYGILEKARYDGAVYAANHIPKDATIVAGGIGMIGWFTNNRIIDALGLVSPETLPIVPKPHIINALEAVTIEYKPSYVFDSQYSNVGQPHWPQVFTDCYREVARFPHNSPQFTDFVLWERTCQ